MAKTSQRSLINKILLFSAFLLGFTFQGVYGQSTLSPGDIAIVTVNADSPDNFDFVPLIDLEVNTEIYFTDIPYVDDAENLDSESNEGVISYTAPTSISAGTIVSYSGSDRNGFEHNSGTFNTAAGGDNLIAYQVVDTDTTYLFGAGWARGSSVWNYDPDTSPNQRSDIPPNLSEGNDTILSLGTTDNYQYNAENGLEGTATSLLSLIGDESNWNEEDDNTFSSFATDFTLIDPPTIAFTSSAVSGEEGNTVNLTVEFVEADNVDVNVDVAFLAGSSTADDTDIDNYAMETLEFSGASTGDSQDVTITLTGSDGFEGTEKAVFQLQNNSKGTIIDPSELTLTITDDEAPDIVFNEINADPGDDANGDGDTDSESDEFIEWVNNSDQDIDISRWEYQDSGTSSFTFPEGTVIPAGNAVVLFDSGTASEPVMPQGNFGGAFIFSDTEVGLNNSSEELMLFDANGNTVATATYPNNASGESNNLDPNVTGTNYVNHSTLSGGSKSSSGTKVDGTPFGSKHAIGIRGTEGWRMISSPVQNASFNDFFGDFWMQGVTGSDDTSPDNGGSTIYSWNESGAGAFTAPTNMSDNLEPGKGYIVYFFEDDDNSSPGIQGGFPKVVNTDKEENSGTVTVDVSATDDGSDGITGNEGWNLLGNPFDTDISVSAVINALEAVDPSVNTNISVWNHESASWEILDGKDTSNDRIAPFQAFFVHFDSDFGSEQVSFVKNDLEANQGTEFYKNSIEDIITFDLQLHGDQYYDTYSLEFSEYGTTELDRYDAYKLFSLNSDAISLFSTQSNNRLQKNALPRELESNLEIPLSFDANGRTALTFQWDNSMGSIPNEWDLILIDNQQNREVNLRRDKEYSFSVNQQQEKMLSSSDKKGLLNKAKETQDSRFVLSVQPNVQDEISSDLPESVKLKPNYPNPFNPTTTIPYELTQDSDVLLTVWNMIGQKVATLVDGTVEAGTHEEMWNASDMPSGIYIARFEVNGTVFTRKMTLIK